MSRSFATPSCESRRSLSARFTSTASRTLSLSSFAFAKPRSANTLPLPASTLIRFFAIAFLVIFLRRPQPGRDERDIRARCPDTARRFLLKGVQHVNRSGEPDRVHRSIGSACIALAKFPHAGTKSLPWTGARRLLAILNGTHLADSPDHAHGESKQIALRR